jgi:putative sugar O-methyltransferase
MDTFKSQLERFISGSPDFFNDGSLPEIDTKHQKIISSAYELLHSDFSIEKLRNWNAQSDMGSMRRLNLFYRLMIDAQDKKSLAYKLFHPLVSGLQSMLQVMFSFSLNLDDIRVIESIGAKDLLEDNPQNTTPGAAQYPLVEGYSVSVRWLRYIYLLARIRQYNLVPDNGTWVDIGSFYGGLQGLVRKYNPSAKIVMVDFHHQLLRSYIYLDQLYPGSRHFLPGEVDSIKDFSSLPPGSFVYVPVNDFHKIQSHKAQLVSNFFSFGEMRREHFANYFDSDLLQRSDSLYFVNRFISSPFFEKTYDSDITIKDYLIDGRTTRHFDVLPVNHYQVIKRKVYERTFLRNVSSPYFDMIY